MIWSMDTYEIDDKSWYIQGEFIRGNDNLERIAFNEITLSTEAGGKWLRIHIGTAGGSE